jgi:phosphoserine phosphatase
MSEQLKAALVRGLIIAVPTGILTTLTTWSQTDDAKTLVIAGGTSLVGTFLARSGLEGAYDTKREREGNVHSGDVGGHATPSPPTPQPTG